MKGNTTMVAFNHAGATFNYVGAAAVQQFLPDIPAIGGPGSSQDFVMWLLFERDAVTA